MQNIRFLVAGAIVLVLIMSVAAWRDGQDVSPEPTEVTEEAKVEVYFAHSRLGDYSQDCDDVFVVYRRTAENTNPLEAAVTELLEGPTLAEETEGYVTNIASGAELRSLEVIDGVASVTFSEGFLENVAGACRIESIRTQVEKTLMQFPEVKSVTIKVEGVPDEEVLQP
jgi:spore germination protein GerM